MKGSQALGQIKSPEHIIMDMTLYPEEINIPKIIPINKDEVFGFLLSINFIIGCKILSYKKFIGTNID
ncbi:MAG: hypothetical protein CL740_00090 [Chloroflexi bacterium]|nr:hypothetical protein [Chloroflexota bacterium]|tara:strand:- start:10284 stop:10487 length:204 start_codon:yes stop_codon:yes gene_type:complete